MAKKQDVNLKKIGHYSFIAGIILAVLMALVQQLETNLVTWVLIVLGLFVGLLNITAKETDSFLIAAAALIVSSIGLQNVLFRTLGIVPAKILDNVLLFIGAVAVIVAIKSVYGLAED